MHKIDDDRLVTETATFWRVMWRLLGASLLWSAPTAAEPIYSNKCGPGFYFSYSGEVLGDAPSTTSQKTVNCFAWRQFIGLNWPAAGRRFGEAGDRNPVRWQTFPSEAEVLRPAGHPSSIGRAPLPAACAARVRAAGVSRPEELTILQAPSGLKKKRSRINSTEQAGASNEEAAWVGASNNTNIWYEIRINPEEAEYIVSNRLYDAEAQAAFVATGHPLVLPKGDADGPAGAIELKAAWMEVPDPENSKWTYFKTSDAAVLDATGTDCRLTQVALVGLHIIQKTARQPSFFWATFEHIDNVPDDSGPVSGSYNLYSDHCEPQSVMVDDPSCLAGQAAGATPRLVTIGCTPNSRPPYRIGGACPAPRAIQTTRLTPIEPDTDDVNQMVQAGIGKTFPDSVWQNYKLVNVQWALGIAVDPEAPLAGAARLPKTLPSIPVANTTMETYLQTTTCTTCHVNAALANPSTYSADFSFVFQSAGR
jgi:hypothetical protein